MHMAFLSRGFKNLKWYSMTEKRPDPVIRPFFCAAGAVVSRIKRTTAEEGQARNAFALPLFIGKDLDKRVGVYRLFS